MNGPGYLVKGINMLWQPGIRGFVIIPLLVNLLVFAGLTYFLMQQFNALMDWMMTYIPQWLDFIVWLLWLIFGLVLLVVYGYSFAIFGNLLAAPFYGLLAERVQTRVTGKLDQKPLTFALAWRIARSSLVRELHKLLYFLPRIALVLLTALIFSFIPVLNLLVPLLFFFWGSWSLAIEFLDYPADNNDIGFTAMKQQLHRQRTTSLSFGAATLALTSLPVINMLALPGAVIGATLMWLDLYGDPPENRLPPATKSH